MIPWLEELSHGGETMDCPRCKSPMYAELYDDALDSHGQGFSGMHCLMCGNIIDPVILEHRRSRVEPHVRHPRLTIVVST